MCKTKRFQRHVTGPSSACVRTYCVPGREACDAGVMSHFIAVETEVQWGGRGGCHPLEVIGLRLTPKHTLWRSDIWLLAAGTPGFLQ